MVGAQRLLGRHVRDLALDDAGGGLLALALRLGDAEVGQLDLALLADEDVVRADVAVDDAQRLAVARLGVRVGERAADLGDDVERQRGGQTMPAAYARCRIFSRSQPSTSSSARK